MASPSTSGPRSATTPAPRPPPAGRPAAGGRRCRRPPPPFVAHPDDADGPSGLGPAGRWPVPVAIHLTSGLHFAGNLTSRSWSPAIRMPELRYVGNLNARERFPTLYRSSPPSPPDLPKSAVDVRPW